MRLLICTQAVDQKDPILGFFHDWLLEFAKQCESVVVICLRKGEYHVPQNVRVLSLGKEEGKSRLTYLFRFYAYELRNIFSYDAVFVHMNPEYVLLGWCTWKLFRKRVALWYTHKSVTLTLRLASRMVDVVTTASKESFRLERKNVQVLGHGIDAKMFSRPHTRAIEALHITTAGRIARSKNIHLMLQAVSQLPKLGVPYRFTIVGVPVTRDDQAYRTELMEQIEMLGLTSFVGFAGAKMHSEMPMVLAQTDVFLHASGTGSLDKAMLEAMAAGCVVVSSSDAAQTILTQVQDGLAVSRPDPELLASAIQRAYAMGEEERVKIGERSRSLVVEKHSLIRLVECIINICKGIKNK